MADGAKYYRERAAAERELAAGAGLPNVRERALRAAARWDELAMQAERGKVATTEKQEREAYLASIARTYK